MDTVKTGSFLKELRKEKGLTQEQLGEKVGVTNKTVSRWENGKDDPADRSGRSAGNDQQYCKSGGPWAEQGKV